MDKGTRRPAGDVWGYQCQGRQAQDERNILPKAKMRASEVRSIERDMTAGACRRAFLGFTRHGITKVETICGQGAE